MVLMRWWWDVLPELDERTIGGTISHRNVFFIQQLQILKLNPHGSLMDSLDRISTCDLLEDVCSGLVHLLVDWPISWWTDLSPGRLVRLLVDWSVS